MFKSKCMAAGIAALLAGGSAWAAATGTTAEEVKRLTKQPRQERIYGSQMMTPQERDEYMARVRRAKTQAERDQIRAEHHKAMQERAKERGVTLPEERRMGRHMGPGSGRGMGNGPAPGGGPNSKP